MINKFDKIDEDELVKYFKVISKKQNLNQHKKQLIQLINDQNDSILSKETESILKVFPHDYLLQFDERKSEGKIKSIELKCQKHGKDIIGIDLNDTNALDNLYCIQCMSGKQIKITSIEDIENLIKQYCKVNQEYCQKFKQILDKYNKKVNDFAGSRILKINKKLLEFKYLFEHIINKKYQLIQNKIQSLNELRFDLQLQKDRLNLIELQKFHENQKDQINLQLEQMIVQIQNNQTLNINNLKEFLIKTKKLQEGFFKTNCIQFNLIQNSSVKMQEKCHSIAINDKANIVLVGQDKKILVFEFNNQRLFQKQILNDCISKVNYLTFFKKQNKFISDDNKNLKIWTQDQKGLWSQTQILNGHSSWIQSIIINQNDNLIASGSDDKSIKLWTIKEEKWVNTQTNEIHQDIVYSLCFNPSNNLLISCGADNLILILEKKSDDWVVIQQIHTNQFGYRLCFLSDQLFVFQPDSSQFFTFYQKNIENQQEFIKFKEHQIQLIQSSTDSNIFPHQFCQQKKILLLKYGQYIIIFKEEQENEFELQQQIMLKHSQIVGTISNDGEFLLTYDHYSKEIQVRKCQSV